MKFRLFSLLMILSGAFVFFWIDLSQASEQEVRAEQKTPQPRAVSVRAKLIDSDYKSQFREATVQVEVQGVRLVEPPINRALKPSGPKLGQAHLHYQLDEGPIVSTTATQLTFHHLGPGEHRIGVKVAANDHSTIVSAPDLRVLVP